MGIMQSALFPIKMTLQEKKLAIKAAKALKLSIVSVDIIRSKQGPLILDVDPSPSFETIEQVCEIDIANAILEFIEDKILKYHENEV